MYVTIDGVQFVPACGSASRIGIAITTHQRTDVLKQALEQHMKHPPAGALMVVFDDGSKPVAASTSGLQQAVNDAVGDAIRNALKPGGMIWSSLQSCQH